MAKAKIEIFNYMTKRAAFEKMPHELTEAFYLGGLQIGCRNFFGVDVDDDGRVLGDFQNKKFFEIWKSKN